MVQLSPNLLGSGPATIGMPLRSWISHRQLASLFCLAIACLLHGHSQSAHVLPLNCGGPLAGMKLLCLDGPCCAEWTTGHEHGGQIGTRRWRQGAVCQNDVRLDAFWPGCIQVLDSLDVEGNTGTKQDPCHLGQGYLDDKASYALDVCQGQILFRMPRWPGLLVSIQGTSSWGLPGCNLHRRDARVILGSGLVLHRQEDV